MIREFSQDVISLNHYSLNVRAADPIDRDGTVRSVKGNAATLSATC